MAYLDSMYCPWCDSENVKFNSVGLFMSRPSYFVPIGEDGAYGGINKTSSTIVNVCASCGCEDLYFNRSVYYQVKEKLRRDAARKKFLMLTALGIFIAGIIWYIIEETKLMDMPMP